MTKKTQAIMIRVNDDEKYRIEHNANQVGVKTGAYARAMAMYAHDALQQPLHWVVMAHDASGTNGDPEPLAAAQKLKEEITAFEAFVSDKTVSNANNQTLMDRAIELTSGGPDALVKAWDSVTLAESYELAEFLFDALVLWLASTNN